MDRDRKGIDVYKDMRDGEWATRNAAKIWIAVIVASLVISFGVYRAFFGSPDDTDFKRMLFRVGKNVAGADRIEVEDVALISNFSYLAYGVKFYRKKSLIAHFSEVSIALYPLTAFVGDVYTEADLKFKKGGSLQVIAHIPPLQVRNLSNVNFSSMEVKADEIPLQAVLGALMNYDAKDPIKIRSGNVSGRISFDNKREVETKTGFMHLSVKKLDVTVDCRHPSIRWQGCKTRQVPLDPFNIYTRIEKGKMTLVDPILLRIHLRKETAKVNGSAILRYPPAVRLEVSSPSNAPITNVIQGLFGCKAKRRANYKVGGTLGRLKCR